MVATHPIHYFAPLYAEYAKDPRIALRVAYCSLQGAEPGRDPGFGIDLAWDVPLLDGYQWANPRNRSLRPGYGRFFGLVNPGLWGPIARREFDVVVAHGYGVASYWIAGAAAHVGHARLVLVTDTHSLTGIRSRSWKITAKRAILPPFLKVFDAFFATSSRTVTFLRSLGVPDHELYLTPYVVDSPAFGAAVRAADGSALRQRLNVPEGAPVALFCGKLVPWKRPADVIEAVRAVSGLHALFAGDGEERSRLEARADALGVSDRVHFLGFVNRTNLPDAYAASDLLVLPSSTEAFGLVVNEAFAAGIPAVVSDACGAVGDLVRPNETGLVIPAGDVNALVRSVRRLAEDPRERQAMGRRARERIHEWGPAQNVEAFVAACMDLAGGSNGGPAR